MAALGAPPDDSQRAGEANIAEAYLTSQQRREAPAPPQPEGLARILTGCPASAGLLVSQRPQRVFSFLLPVRLGPPRTQPKFAAALLYEPQTWCTEFLGMKPLVDSYCRVR
jgi:hypothetical protein